MNLLITYCGCGGRGYEAYIDYARILWFLARIPSGVTLIQKVLDLGHEAALVLFKRSYVCIIKPSGKNDILEMAPWFPNL